ncbi:ABC transporter ATP-binding protein [Niveispirillum sp. KHB5.9]|uniref:ABC transporter ATP-binding protein n=1 Tax=Niveispirillum sp. KHB5.9 TaxID=3400269 RepID=UPI003A86EC60
MADNVLDISGLHVSYATDRGPLRVLRGVDLSVARGEITGIVGESGCGKSTLIAGILGLLSGNATLGGGSIRLDGRDLLGLDEAGMRALRGDGLALVSQNPMAAFNPVLTIGRQLTDIQYRHAVPVAEKRRRIVEMFARVGIVDPERRLAAYPGQLSGGMLQRIAIAAALLTRPRLLIADEPTTALDVTLEAQILSLLRAQTGTSILFISHHLGAVATLCDRVAVMYAGTVVETGPVDQVFAAPRHPYTRRLIAADPGHLAVGGGMLPTIPGRVPDLTDPPLGCVFAPRCLEAEERCRSLAPALHAVDATRRAACHRVSP